MVIYEDNHLLVVNKACGELVQGDATRDKTILDRYKSYIKHKYSKPGEVFLHPAHRLDRPVSGCLILARTSKGLSRMTQAFKANAVQKKYHAITSSRSTLPDGILEHHLLKDTQRNISKVCKPGQKKSKKATLEYRLLANSGTSFLYEVSPQTGRSHQIRVQLSTVGCPIIGDVKYGGRKIDDVRMIYLHCSTMTFVHPVKKEEMIVSCIPAKGDRWKAFHSFL